MRIYTLTEDEKEVARLGRKIFAIEMHRERTGSSLIEAKDEVERYLANKDLYDQTNSNQQQEQKRLDELVANIKREAEILENVNFPISRTNKQTRSNVYLLMNNRDRFEREVRNLLKGFLEER